MLNFKHFVLGLVIQEMFNSYITHLVRNKKRRFLVKQMLYYHFTNFSVHSIPKNQYTIVTLGSSVLSLQFLPCIFTMWTQLCGGHTQGLMSCFY